MGEELGYAIYLDGEEQTAIFRDGETFSVWLKSNGEFHQLTLVKRKLIGKVSDIKHFPKALSKESIKELSNDS